MASGQIDYLRILDCRDECWPSAARARSRLPCSRRTSRLPMSPTAASDCSTPILVRDIHHGEVRLGVSISPLNQLIITARQWRPVAIAALEMALVALFSWLLGTHLARQLVAQRAQAPGLPLAISPAACPCKAATTWRKPRSPSIAWPSSSARAGSVSRPRAASALMPCTRLKRPGAVPRRCRTTEGDF